MTIRSTDILSLTLMLPVSPHAHRGGAASRGAQPPSHSPRTGSNSTCSQNGSKEGDVSPSQSNLGGHDRQRRADPAARDQGRWRESHARRNRLTTKRNPWVSYGTKSPISAANWRRHGSESMALTTRATIAPIVASRAFRTYCGAPARRNAESARSCSPETVVWRTVITTKRCRSFISRPATGLNVAAARNVAANHQPISRPTGSGRMLLGTQRP
jgi:hypothetical protein